MEGMNSTGERLVASKLYEVITFFYFSMHFPTTFHDLEVRLFCSHNHIICRGLVQGAGRVASTMEIWVFSLFVKEDGSTFNPPPLFSSLPPPQGVPLPFYQPVDQTEGELDPVLQREGLALNLAQNRGGKAFQPEGHITSWATVWGPHASSQPPRDTYNQKQAPEAASQLEKLRSQGGNRRCF